VYIPGIYGRVYLRVYLPGYIPQGIPQGVQWATSRVYQGVQWTTPRVYQGVHTGIYTRVYLREERDNEAHILLFL